MGYTATGHRPSLDPLALDSRVIRVERPLCGKRTVKENINRMLVHRPGSVFGRKEEKGAGRETNRNQKSPVCGDFGICPIPFDKCASIPRMGDDNLPDCSFCPGYFVLYAEESLDQD